MSLLLLVAVVAMFASGFYAGAWYMNRVLNRVLDEVLPEVES